MSSVDSFRFLIEILISFFGVFSEGLKKERGFNLDL